MIKLITNLFKNYGLIIRLEMQEFKELPMLGSVSITVYNNVTMIHFGDWTRM